MSKLIRAQLGVFLYGFAFWFPIAILIFVLIFLFNNVEDIGRNLFVLFLSPDFYHTGYGLLLGLIVVYLSGLILKMARVRKRLAKIPILGLFFGEGEVITVDRLLHLTPCLFLMSPTCLSYGWVLSEEKVEIMNSGASFSILNVYYPNVPTLITGQVFPVRKDTVIRLANPSKEIIDLLLYSFRSPNAIQYMPWEGETPEEFAKRANAFGVHFIPSEWKSGDTFREPKPGSRISR
jgi:hypothetical protein